MASITYLNTNAPAPKDSLALQKYEFPNAEAYIKNLTLEDACFRIVSFPYAPAISHGVEPDAEHD